MSHRLSLEQIKIAEPCHKSWDAMTGDAQKRFCDSCSKHVYDLSTMTREDAEALVNRGESVCIRMQRDAGGSVKTKPMVMNTRDTKADRFPPRWMRAAASVAAMLGITSLFQSGCKKEEPNHVLGEMIPKNVRTMGLVALPDREMGAVAPSTQPIEPAFEMGDIAAPSTQPVEPILIGVIAAPATQPAVQPTALPMVMGRIAMPATQPSTQPTTRSSEEPIKMGKVAPAATQPGEVTFTPNPWAEEMARRRRELARGDTSTTQPTTVPTDNFLMPTDD